jgi:hypothetical protein
MKAFRAVTVASVMLSAVVLAADTRLGSGVTLQTATAIADLVERPEAFVGKTVRVNGVATAVCSHMGCWMALAPEDRAEGPTVRLKVEDGVIVFPVSAKGKRVAAEGVFERVGRDEESHEAAGEHAAQDAKASKTYQIAATGAVIRD